MVDVVLDKNNFIENQRSLKCNVSQTMFHEFKVFLKIKVVV